MKTMLFFSLATNVILFALLLIYHILSENDIKKLQTTLRKEQAKKRTKPTFKRV